LDINQREDEYYLNVVQNHEITQNVDKKDDTLFLFEVKKTPSKRNFDGAFELKLFVRLFLTFVLFWLAYNILTGKVTILDRFEVFNKRSVKVMFNFG